MPTQHVPGGTTSTSASNDGAAPARDDAVDEAQVLVEDVSIDGMCGVY